MIGLESFLRSIRKWCAFLSRYSFVRNFSFFAAGNVISKAILFLVNAYLARIFSPEYFGKIIFAQTALLFGMVFTESVRWLAIRDVAHASGINREEIVRETWATMLVLGGVSWLAIIITTIGLSDPTERKLILLIGFVIPVSVLNIDWFLKGQQRFKPVSLAEVFKSFFYLCALVVFVRRPGNLFIVPLAYVLGWLIAAGYIFFTIRSNVSKLLPRFNLSRFRSILLAAVPIILNGFMVQFYLNSGIVFLKIFSSPYAVGLFGAALKLVLLITVFSAFFGETLLPAMTASYAVSEIQGWYLTKRIFWILGGIGVFITMIFVGFAGFILHLAYGLQYMVAISVFQILAFSIIPYFLYVPLMNLLIIKHLERRLFLASLLGVLFNCIISFFLVPRFGAPAAAFATVFTQVVVVISSALFFRQAVGIGVSV